VSVRGNPPGTRSKLTYDVGGPEAPEPGDFLCAETGTCYAIEEVSPSPSKPGRVYLKVTKLDQFAVEIGEPGVWPLYWHPRN
jgi:hypothetical protein